MATVFKTIERRSLQPLWSAFDQYLFPYIEKGVVIAVSGGPDSRALLEAIARWPKRAHGKFLIATIDHAQRRESSKEADFIENRAQRLGFDAVCETLPYFLEKSSEEDLRIGRYRELIRIAKREGLNAIVTAHHCDDDAEGYLMALLGLGGGVLGAAMKEVIIVDGINVLRPFLHLSKNELLLSLTLQNQTDFIKDSLDDAGIGARAYVRKEILPTLLKTAPSIKNRLARFAKAQEKSSAVLDNLAKSLVIFKSDSAEINLKNIHDCELLTNAIWFMLKNLASGRDLRSSQVTIEKIVNDFQKSRILRPGLDQHLNGFNVNPLKRKEYQFPGVLVITNGGIIKASRV